MFAHASAGRGPEKCLGAVEEGRLCWSTVHCNCDFVKNAGWRTGVPRHKDTGGLLYVTVVQTLEINSLEE